MSESTEWVCQWLDCHTVNYADDTHCTRCGGPREDGW